MSYSLFIALSSVTIGLIYSLGVFADRIRHVVGEHVPMQPLPVGVLVLFVIGATLGLYLACVALPAKYLETRQGQKLMGGLSGTRDVQLFRTVCATAVLVIVSGTMVVLWYAYGFVRD
jgi:hypothetical protein